MMVLMIGLGLVGVLSAAENLFVLSGRGNASVFIVDRRLKCQK